jgi:hypothetical protein
MKLPQIKQIRFNITEIFAAGFIWMFTVALIIVPSASLAGYDAFYNAAVAELMRNGTWVIKDFPWTTCSVWVHSYFDKEWLFHLFLVPFISIFGKIEGIKFVTAFTVFFIAVAWGLLLKSAGVKKNIFWALVFILFSTGYIFPARIALCRSLLFSLLFLPLALSALLTRSKILLAVVLFLYTLSYVGAWQVIPLIIIYDIIYFRSYGTGIKNILKNLILPWGILGITAGLLCSPYFPENIKGIFIQTVMVLKAKWYGTGAADLMQASELEPIQLSRLIWHLPLFILVIHAIVNLFKIPAFRKNFGSPAGYFSVLTVLYMILTIFSQRFIEYFAPVSGVFLFLVYTNYGKEMLQTVKIQPLKKLLTHHPAAALAFVLVPVGIISINMLFHNFYKPELFYKKSSDWLSKHIKDNQIIFTTGWNDSSVLFCHVPQFRYLVMLEPYFMYAYSPEKFILWQKISKGKIENPSLLIKSEFDSSVVFVTHNMQALKHKLLMDPYAELQYESKETGESIFTLSVPRRELEKFRNLQKSLKNRNFNDKS